MGTASTTQTLRTQERSEEDKTWKVRSYKVVIERAGEMSFNYFYYDAKGKELTPNFFKDYSEFWEVFGAFPQSIIQKERGTLSLSKLELNFSLNTFSED